MSQLELTSDASPTDPGARKESYQQWRRRLADRQDDLRHLGEQETEPALSSEWSPEALFITGGGSTAADDGSVDLTVPSEESAPAEPELLGPIVAAGSDPVTDDGWDRSEVDALLRQFRATVGSPRAASRVLREAGGLGVAGGQPPVEHGSDPVSERDDEVVRYFDGSRVVRTASAEQARVDASVGQQLRELNRLRVEGKLDEDEFNRRKRALFTRGAAARRSSL